jgi:outer membrane protein TolC
VKHFYAVVLLAMALPLVAQGQTQPAPVPGPASAPLTVDEAVAEAHQGNLAIRAAVRRLSLAQMKISTARSLDDPMFQVRDWGTPITKPWDLNQAQVMLMVQQTFPSRMKRNMRAKVAGDDAAVAAEELETLRQQVDADVRKACADLKRNADEMKLHDRQSDLLKEAVAAALAQYTTGKVPQADVLRAQMAMTRLSEHLIELEEERDTARTALNALLGRRADDAIEITGAYAAAASLPPLEDLERIALEHRPELAGLRQQIAQSHDRSQLTRLAMKPDFTVGAGYMLMPTGSMARNAYMAEVGMNLPWLNRERHDGEAKQADAATEVTKAELEARTTVVFSEIRQAQIALQAAEKRTKLYRDTLLPQAEATFKASAAAYQNNRAEFQMLIDSQNLLLDIQTAFYKASAATDAGLAQLQRAVGAPLPTDERTSK